MFERHAVTFFVDLANAANGIGAALFLRRDGRTERHQVLDPHQDRSFGWPPVWKVAEPAEPAQPLVFLADQSIAPRPITQYQRAEVTSGGCVAVVYRERG